MSHYGKAPINLGQFPIECKEALYYLYLPIKFPGMQQVVIPANLERFEPLLTEVLLNARQWVDQYVYITAKHTWVAPGTPANRPGWHSDGFLTDDENFIWCDSMPTIFNTSDFVVDADHEKSLDQFWPQALPENDLTYPAYSLLQLDQYVIHRVDEPTKGQWRTFVKISVSANQYNLTGNSHNYDLNYNWTMHDRAEVRNDPHRAQKEAV